MEGQTKLRQMEGQTELWKEVMEAARKNVVYQPS